MMGGWISRWFTYTNDGTSCGCEKGEGGWEMNGYLYILWSDECRDILFIPPPIICLIAARVLL